MLANVASSLDVAATSLLRGICTGTPRWGPGGDIRFLCSRRRRYKCANNIAPTTNVVASLIGRVTSSEKLTRMVKSRVPREAWPERLAKQVPLSLRWRPSRIESAGGLSPTFHSSWQFTPVQVRLCNRWRGRSRKTPCSFHPNLELPQERGSLPQPSRATSLCSSIYVAIAKAHFVIGRGSDFAGDTPCSQGAAW